MEPTACASFIDFCIYSVRYLMRVKLPSHGSFVTNTRKQIPVGIINWPQNILKLCFLLTKVKGQVGAFISLNIFLWSASFAESKYIRVPLAAKQTLLREGKQCPGYISRWLECKTLNFPPNMQSTVFSIRTNSCIFIKFIWLSISQMWHSVSYKTIMKSILKTFKVQVQKFNITIKG